MFGLANLFGKEKESMGPEAMLNMLTPFLKIKGIDLQTIVPETAGKLHAAQMLAGVQIVAMIGTNDNGDGFDLVFYRMDPDTGLKFLHLVPITDVSSALQEFQSLPTTFTNLITQQNAPTDANSDNANIDAAASEPNAADSGNNDADEPGATGTAGEPGAGSGSGSIDPLDSPDAE